MSFDGVTKGFGPSKTYKEAEMRGIVFGSLLLTVSISTDAGAVEFSDRLGCAQVDVYFDAKALESQQYCFKLTNNCNRPIALQIVDRVTKLSTGRTLPGERNVVCGHNLTSRVNGFFRY